MDANAKEARLSSCAVVQRLSELAAERNCCVLTAWTHGLACDLCVCVLRTAMHTEAI